mgnify:CR=1 FL=1
MFLHTAMTVSGNKKDQVDHQLEALVAKIKEQISHKEELMKQQIAVVGQLEFIEQNEGILKEKIISNIQNGGGDNATIKTSIVLWDVFLLINNFYFTYFDCY